MKLICKEVCNKKRLVKGKGWTLLTSALFLFMPKCALCWAAYMSFLSSLGFVIKYQPWFLPVITILFLVTLTKLLISSIRSKNFISFMLAVVAGLLIFLQRASIGVDGVKIFAIVLMGIALQMDNLLNLYNHWLDHSREKNNYSG